MTTIRDEVRRAEARAIQASRSQLVTQHSLLGELVDRLGPVDAQLKAALSRRSLLELQQARARIHRDDALEVATSTYSLAYHAVDANQVASAELDYATALSIRASCFPRGAGSRLRRRPQALRRALEETLELDALAGTGAVAPVMRTRLEEVHARLSETLDQLDELQRQRDDNHREISRIRGQHDELRRAIGQIHRALHRVEGTREDVLPLFQQGPSSPEPTPVLVDEEPVEDGEIDAIADGSAQPGPGSLQPVEDPVLDSGIAA